MTLSLSDTTKCKRRQSRAAALSARRRPPARRVERQRAAGLKHPAAGTGTERVCATQSRLQVGAPVHRGPGCRRKAPAVNSPGPPPDGPPHERAGSRGPAERRIPARSAARATGRAQCRRQPVNLIQRFGMGSCPHAFCVISTQLARGRHGLCQTSCVVQPAVRAFLPWHRPCSFQFSRCRTLPVGPLAVRSGVLCSDFIARLAITAMRVRQRSHAIPFSGRTKRNLELCAEYHRNSSLAIG